MRRRFTIAPEADLDIAEIKFYLLENAGLQTARAVMSKLRQEMIFLGQTPGAGHLREDLISSDVKFWPVPPYVIIYNHHRKPIEIVRILHGKRNLPSILESDSFRDNFY